MLSNTSTWTIRKNGRGGYELSQDEIPVANFWNEYTARLVCDVMNTDSTAEKLHQLLLARADAAKPRPPAKGSDTKGNPPNRFHPSERCACDFCLYAHA